MSRPRVGHGTTAFSSGGKLIWLFQDENGIWLTTGHARGWPRCTRCRRPHKSSPFDSGLCSTCYFYKTGLPADEFWRLHKTGYYLAPYNIGDRCMRQERLFDRTRLDAPHANWRAILKSQVQ